MSLSEDPTQTSDFSATKGVYSYLYYGASQIQWRVA